MAKIIIHRKPSFSHRFRSFEIYIDGEKAGSIKNDDTQEFAVSPGYHKVHSKMSWYYSDVFNVKVEENEIKYLKVDVSQQYLGMVYALLAFALITPLVFRSATWYDEKTFSVIRLVALILVIAHGLYHSFIARKRYLRVSEDSNNIFNQ